MILPEEIKQIINFWCVDEHGHKYNDYIITKHTANTDIEADIAKKWKLNLDKCYEFGYRKVEF